MVGAAILGVILIAEHGRIDGFRTILMISLMTLFVHQFEEYELPGGFPQMINTVMYRSPQPDNFPLNRRTAFIINVLGGWLAHVLAVVLGGATVWLAVATFMVSIGNVIAHLLVFNLRGKTTYNPGMATALFLFLPLSIVFFVYGVVNDYLTAPNLLVGIVVGAGINYLVVIRLITELADERSPFGFESR